MNKDSQFDSVTEVEVISNPVQMEGPKTVLPRGITARAEEPKLKVTSASPERDVSRDATLAMHFLNPPLFEGAIFVPRMKEQIRQFVDSWQLEHETKAFYEVYSKLLVVEASENPATWTTSYLIRNHEVFDERLAHKIFHYINASIMYASAVANACILNQVNGQGRFKNFGLAFKVGNLNTFLNRMASFPVPKDIYAWIQKWMKFAVGKASKAADFISIPLINTTIWGNVGQHHFNIDDGYAASLPTADGLVPLDPASPDYTTYVTLLDNMLTTMKMYGYGETEAGSNEHHSYIGKRVDPTGAHLGVLSMPHVDAGESLHFETSGVNYEFKGNSDSCEIPNGNVYVKDASTGAQISTDNIINRIWDNLEWMQEYMIAYFHDFAEPVSPIRDFFMKSIALLSDGTDVSHLLASINADSTLDAADLCDAMRYKRNNAATTATIVRWVPILDGDGSEYLNRATGFFAENFERYPSINISETEMLKEAEKWPHLTPTVFHDLVDVADADRDKYMFKVANTIASGTTELDIGATNELAEYGEVTYPAQAPIGKNAVLLDMASSASVSPEHTAIDSIAEDPDDVADFIERCDAMIFRARPTTPYVYRAPTLDVSDPVQCGFCVLICSDAVTDDEWHHFLSNGAEYVAETGDSEPVGCYIPPSGYGTPADPTDPVTPTNPAYVTTKISGIDYMVKAHASGVEHVQTIKHLPVFVGEGIFSHPVVAGAKIHAGNPSMDFAHVNSNESASATAFFAKLKTDSAAITQNQIRTLISPTDPTQMVLHSIMLATQVTSTNNRSAAIKDGQYCISRACDELNTTVAGKVNWFRQVTFAPDYGPVAPAVVCTPGNNFIPLMPMSDNTELVKAAAMHIDAADDASPYNPKMAIKNFGSTDGYNDYSYKLGVRPVMWNSNNSPALFWIYFIDAVHLRKVYQPGYTPVTASEDMQFVGFGPAAKALLALISRGRIFFTGTKDTMDFYNIDADRLRFQDPDIRSGAPIALGALVQVPRVRTRKVEGKSMRYPEAGKLVRTRAKVIQESAGDGAMSLGSEQRSNDAAGSKGDKPAKPGKKNKRNRGKSRSDGRKGNVAREEEDTTFSRGENSFDSASKADEKRFDRTQRKEAYRSSIREDAQA